MGTKAPPDCRPLACKTIFPMHGYAPAMYVFKTFEYLLFRPHDLHCTPEGSTPALSKLALAQPLPLHALRFVCFPLQPASPSLSSMFASCQTAVSWLRTGGFFCLRICPWSHKSSHPSRRTLGSTRPDSRMTTSLILFCMSIWWVSKERSGYLGSNPGLPVCQLCG